MLDSHGARRSARPAMGWSVKGKIFFSQFFIFWLPCGGTLRVRFGSASLACTGFLSGLNLLSVHPCGSTLYRFQIGPEELTETNLQSGLIKRAQGRARFRLRSKSFMRRAKGGLFILHPLAADSQWALRHVRRAARRIGLCGSATRAPGRPWIADASRAWPGTSCARLFFPRMTLQTMAHAKNSSSLHSDLVGCS